MKKSLSLAFEALQNTTKKRSLTNADSVYVNQCIPYDHSDPKMTRQSIIERIGVITENVKELFQYHGLYVGITSNMSARFSSHKTKRPLPFIMIALNSIRQIDVPLDLVKNYYMNAWSFAGLQEKALIQEIDQMGWILNSQKSIGGGGAATEKEPVYIYVILTISKDKDIDND